MGNDNFHPGANWYVRNGWVMFFDPIVCQSQRMCMQYWYPAFAGYPGK